MDFGRDLVGSFGHLQGARDATAGRLGLRSRWVHRYFHPHVADGREKAQECVKVGR